MNKKMWMIIGLSCCMAQGIQADGWGAAIGAILGAIFGDAIERDINQNDWQRRECYTCKTLGNVDNAVRKAPCGHMICQSCINAKIDNANKFNSNVYNVNRGLRKNPSCDCCGADIDYNASAQRVAMQTYEQRSIMCASQCNTQADILFPCKHGMCSSCLKSRAQKAIKQHGNFAVVRCPYMVNGKPCNCEISAEKYIHLLG